MNWWAGFGLGDLSFSCVKRREGKGMEDGVEIEAEDVAKYLLPTYLPTQVFGKDLGKYGYRMR